MAESVPSFESLVVETSWSLAVFEAVDRFDELRPSVLAALASPDGEVRSAAVAALNEANDQDAHDQVASLLADPNEFVRDEVLEYLVDFSVEADVPALFDLLKERKQLFMASRALRRLYPQGPEMFDEEDAISPYEADIAKWEAILGAR